MPAATYPSMASSSIASIHNPGVRVIKGAAVAALLGTFVVAMGVLGVAFILPRLIGMRWKQRTHATHR